MSIWGSQQLASQGQIFYEILQHYYDPGVIFFTLKPYPPNIEMISYTPGSSATFNFCTTGGGYYALFKRNPVTGSVDLYYDGVACSLSVNLAPEDNNDIAVTAAAYNQAGWSLASYNQGSITVYAGSVSGIPDTPQVRGTNLTDVDICLSIHNNSTNFSYYVIYQADNPGNWNTTYHWVATIPRTSMVAGCQDPARSNDASYVATVGSASTPAAFAVVAWASENSWSGGSVNSPTTYQQ
jgi:hypothetical protein